VRKLTVQAYAREVGKHQKTVRRWIRKGLVPIERTPSGGILVVLSSAEAGPNADRGTEGSNRERSGGEACPKAG